MTSRKSKTSKSTRGGVEIGQGSNRSNDSGIPGYGTIEFASWEQHERFHRLLAKPFKPTKFVCTSTLIKMGIHDALKELCEGTGTSAFFSMGENSYQTLTLEFLSAFEYDKHTMLVKFRMSNLDHEMTLPEFGEHFGFERDEDALIQFPDDFNLATVWDRIARGTTCNSSKLRLNDVSHPVIRIWLRLMNATLFNRHEPVNATTLELAILNSFLNVERKKRYSLYLAHFLAMHIQGIAQHDKRSLNLGGLVTHLGKSMEIVDESALQSSNDAAIDFLDLESLRTYYKIYRGDYIWLVRNGEIQLPISRLIPLIALPEARRSQRIEPAYYTVSPRQPSPDVEVTSSLERVRPSRARTPSLSHASSPSHAHDAPFPPRGGEEASFGHIPRAPTYTFGDDGLPTLPNAREQYLHTNLVLYGMHNANVQQGYVPRAGPHPPYFTDLYAPDGGYPGRLYEMTGIDREAYKATYGTLWVDRRPRGGTNVEDGSRNDNVGTSRGGSRRSTRRGASRGNGDDV